MKKSACLFALALIVFAGCRSNRSAKSLDSLREVKIERRTILTLGGKMPSTADFCNWSGATCALKPGTFGGAEAMSLGKTETGLIYEFHFYYGVMSTDAVNAQIDDYTRILGKPSTDSKAKIGEFDVRELVWSDSATTFELSYKSDRKQVEASATLSDNALAGPAH
jgi:hypothetical protein